MIYVYVEDSTKGLGLMKRAFREYAPDLNITIESFEGIINITDHIANLHNTHGDKFYYIYDNIIDNPVINLKILDAKKLIKRKKNIELLSITSFEYNLNP